MNTGALTVTQGRPFPSAGEAERCAASTFLMWQDLVTLSRKSMIPAPRRSTRNSHNNHLHQGTNESVGEAERRAASTFSSVAGTVRCTNKYPLPLQDLVI